MTDHEGATKRAHYDSIEFDDQLALVEGRPFTGTVFATHPDGRTSAEYAYVEGLPDGLQLEWYPNGQLESRSVAIRGKGSSEVTYWYENGQMKSQRFDKDGWPAEVKEWDPDGKLVRHAKYK